VKKIQSSDNELRLKSESKAMLSCSAFFFSIDAIWSLLFKI